MKNKNISNISGPHNVPNVVDSTPRRTRGGKRHGAGRKRKYSSLAITRSFSLPQSISEVIDRLAVVNNCSPSTVIMEILQRELHRYKKTKTGIDKTKRLA